MAVLSLTSGPNLYLEADAKPASSFADIAKRAKAARKQISRSKPSSFIGLRSNCGGASSTASSGNLPGWRYP
jgi:hypothetical protein